jgi:hypothetical protein
MLDDIKISPYHEWGDTDFDWKALDEAAYYLEAQCRKWGRVGIWTKEKYGTLRVSTTGAFALEYDFLHSLFYPGCTWIRWPKWIRIYIDWPIGKLLKVLKVIKLFNMYQVWVLKYFWKRAAVKWPNVAAEILDEYEWTFE